MNVTVYCGVSAGDNPAYLAQANALGTWIGRNGHTLVWGAGTTGLMGAVAEAVLDAGGTALGVIPDFLIGLEPPFEDDFGGRLTIEVTQDMGTRRARMIELGDAFVALPGGPGTVDEMGEIMAYEKLGTLDAPAVLLSVDGYYDAFVATYDAMVEHGFTTAEVRAKLLVASSAAEAAALLEQVR